MYKEEPQEEEAKSFSFLDKTSYEVDLTEIYSVETPADNSYEVTCAYNYRMNYCPILVKINDKNIRNLHSDGQDKKYLL
jgi:hypothetical protein